MSNVTNSLDATSQIATRSRRLWMAVVLGSLSAFGPLSLDMYLPSLPILARDLHTSTSLAQFSLTFCLLGLALGQLLAGPFSDVRGRRLPLLASLIIYAVTSLLCAFAPSILALILLRFVQGLAGAAGIVISRAIVRDLYSGSELTKFYSLLMLVNGVAPIVAPIAGGQLLRVTAWPGVFIVLGIIGILMFLAVLFGLPETLSSQNRSAGGIKNTLSTFRGLVSDRVFMGYALAQGLVVAAMFAYISGSPFVLQNIYGVSPQMFSMFFAINGLGIIIATQITGRLVDRVGETKLFISGLGLAFLGGIMLLVMILIGARLSAVLLPLFVVVSSVGIVTTTGFSLAMQNQGQSAGSASALLGLLSFIFGGMVAPLVGLGGSYTAVPMGIVIAVAEASAILCYATLTRHKSFKC
ncbi:MULTISPECIES: multidrug effflux MFS transporter [Aneurinibacillus]|uniref:Bcr/CflA family efflux transporter n=1 Tax=Aneurinibacillus thermoaerophilus TaxID=143495 RepID=A0ABX8Y851_ANETH|nr:MULTISPECIES: multidrug effflux MFS transporter [Aneurinibacillus]AMA72981.1 MFS transporter [Aneurinibacillus sp. XH2]MED0675928.1 multidrug effflux MFS transporter [Aneurinibacillus thermoaerophilus]MED0677797.1 multidrug effflux MFS transporter [Aneurinibacillus thermoaerophilus]MED0737546.1 multidrug effflux MFS transporter [Aneurinibacillus thermoaerophilus]MED0762873.1 multidrug effflux MFS transporter [Aneurinibacillus thermoaerophilus]